MSDKDWEELHANCIGTIRFYIIDNIINNVIDDEFVMII